MGKIQFRFLAYGLIFGLSNLFLGCKTRAQIQQDQSDTSSGTEAAPASDKSVPSSQYSVEELKAEIVKLTGQFEELQHKLETRLGDLEKSLLSLQEELHSSALNSKKETSSSSEIRDDEPVSNDQAFKLLAKKMYSEAAEVFGLVLDQQPEKKIAADAHYGLGMCLYNTNEFKKAIVHLSKVQELHPSSIHGASALFYVAKSFEKLQLNREAQSFYDELNEKYPQSPEAKKIKIKRKGKR